MSHFGAKYYTVDWSLNGMFNRINEHNYSSLFTRERSKFFPFLGIETSITKDNINCFYIITEVEQDYDGFPQDKCPIFNKYVEKDIAFWSKEDAKTYALRILVDKVLHWQKYMNELNDNLLKLQYI